MAQNVKRFLQRRRSAVLAVLALFAIISLAAAGIYYAISSRRPPVSSWQPIPSEGRTSSSEISIPELEEAVSNVTIRLSQGKAQAHLAVPIPVATGEPLTEEEIAVILARLPEFSGDPSDQVDFRPAGDPIPPPRPGETIEKSFPPPPEDIVPPDVESGPLQVVRFSPEGEIPVAPFINITFNQPMAPIATLGDLSLESVPVQIDPPLPGTWQWLGTKTLSFRYASDLIDRLPKATVYRVTVPAGTTSITGGVLDQAVEWTFTTPPPQVTQTIPMGEPQPRDPIFFIHFDQRIDPEAVLNNIRVTAGGSQVGLRLIGEEEVRAEEKTKWLIDNAVDGRWLAFKAQEPLPADTEISVVVGSGTPSAEGPLTTTEDQSYGFRTYAPLTIVEHGCSWGGNRCTPLTPFFIRFNNPIDASVYTDELLRIEPELPGASVNIYGDTIQISGASKGQTTYAVSVDGAIQDIFGQTLGKAETLTFQVGPAEPRLFGSDKLFVTLDPYAEKPVYNIYSINHPRLELQIYAVQPSDWPEFQKYLNQYQRTDVNLKIPGTLVMDKTLAVESPSDALTEVGIDLSEVMDGDFGQFIVVVKPPKGILENDQDIFWQTVHAWVQVTQIGLDAFVDHSEMVVWTTNLKDGEPLANMTVSAGQTGIQVVTGEDGTFRFPIPNGATYLTARQGADQAMLPSSNYYWGEVGWSATDVQDELRWYVFDDRSMYRPGEEVHLKGWIRQVGGKQDGDVGLVSGTFDSVDYRLTDPQGNELVSGQIGVNALGGFDLNFTLPEEVNLGYAQLYLRALGNMSGVYGNDYYHGFQIQEFRRPEFEVTARNETTGPYFAGDSAVVAVKAAYYAGGPLPGADVTWQVSSSPGSYSPPNWPDFNFGSWSPWWWYGGRGEAEYWAYPGGGETEYEIFTGQTDASGEHYLNVDFDISGEPKPVSILAEATVMDVNRQAWTGSTSLLVHPASLYVGIRSDRYFVQRGVPIKVDVIVTDLDGNPVPDRPVEVRAARLEWKTRGGEWAEEEVDVQTCTVGSALEPVTCTFETPLGGSYRITAEVADDMGRINRSQFTRWVSGGELPPARNVEQEKANLIPDKETYQPGDTAQILVQSPFSPAEGLLTVTRSGILYTERFTVEDGTAILNIPIDEAYIPNLNIQVDLSGSSSRTDDKDELLEGAPPRPAFASGQLTLNIPPLQRTLSLALLPGASELEPGGETNLDLVVTDANGNPVPDAELAVVVVDEAVLALTNYELRDPLDAFYSTRHSYLSGYYARASIVLANPLELAQSNVQQTAVEEEALMEKGEAYDGAAPMEAPAAAMPTMTRQADMAAGAAQQAEPIRVRIDFNPLAVFSPEVRTDGNGRASIPVKLPDNLTRYRVMVVAVDAGGSQFGKGEANLTARLPLMVRPSAPRFLNFGDVFELPVVLQNQTDEPMQVQVAIQALNLALTSENGVLVSVPPRDRVEVRFPAAADLAGTARFQVAAISGGFADAASIELPVYTPATTEAFAVYGVIDDGAVAQPVASPSGVFPQYGGLEITTSSTALQALTDAVIYLVNYPFECSEQLASRILGIAALRDVLAAFEAEGLPAPEELEATVARDIETLRTIQNPEGGFPYWRRGQESIPYNSVHVTHALIRAEMKGYSIPSDMRTTALDYLRNIENYYPSYYSQETRWTISAYALYVRSLAGDRDAGKAERLLDEAGLEKISLDALGWLWPVIDDEGKLEQIRRFVSNRVVETAGAANFTTTYDDQNYLLLGSDRRTDAILLDALMGDDPDDDLIPKLVNGLLAHRKRGRWGNTQENTFVLLALDRYFRTYEAQTPEFTARIWLGDTYAGSHSFVGRTTDRSEIDIPMSYLEGEGTQDLIVSKEGVGRLYYRLGLRYAPSDLQLDPLDMGFVVQRVYEAVDDPQDVTYESDGSVHIRAGARVRVRLTMVAQNRRYHVALVDHLPAGLEIVNPDLAVMGGLPPEEQNPEERNWWYWWWPWYEHENMRDERVEAFTTLLWEGVHEYSYIARATTPGTFIVPPAKAEEMYSPEVFGRTGSEVVVVEDY